VVLRVARCFAIELAKAADIVKRDRGLAQRFIIGIYGLGAAQMERRLLLSKGIPARRNLEKRGVVGHRERDLVDSIVGRAFS